MAKRNLPPEPIIDGQTARIQLTRGHFATVDVEDLPIVSGFVWHTGICCKSVYAQTNAGCGRMMRMHTLLMSPPSGMIVDHINGDGLDNRRCNLRLATRADNQRNQRIGSANTSGYKGAYWSKSKNKWHARIKSQGKTHNLGYFNSLTDAARAYDAAANRMFGEFANLNFKESQEGLLG